MNFDFSQTIGIYGLGVEGKSLFVWLKKHHAKNVFIFDDANFLGREISEEEKQEFKNDTKKIGEEPQGQPNSYFSTPIIPEKIITEQDIFSLPLEFLPYMQKIFRSPGVHPKKILKYIGTENREKITSSTQLFLEISPTKNTIGVTGTKGKGTTSSLITKILQEEFSGNNLQKKQIFLGGNIGTPIFDFFDEIQENDVVVLELSSFQLYDVSKSPRISVLLRTDTEHLDWHTDTQDYRNAKNNIFSHQKNGDTLIYLGGSEITQKMVSSAPEISEKISIFSRDEEKFLEITETTTGEKISGTVLENTKNSSGIFTSEIQLRGKFHQENVLPAIAVAKQFGIKNEVIKTVLKKFSGLPMRCELIETENTKIQKIQFFNDSFSTIPETSISALSIIKTPLFLILGGSEKNSDFTVLAKACAQHKNLKKVYLMGITAKKIAQELEKQGLNKSDNFMFSQNLEEIFNDFKKEAQSDDSLLLSPACASFGMFKSYKERGEKFNELVEKF